MQNFISAFQNFESLQKKSPDFLKAFRTNNFDFFNAHGFPLTKNEEWKYTNVAPITQKKYHLSDVATLDNSAEYQAFTAGIPTKFVFVNGNFSRHLSDVSKLPSGVSVQNLNDIVMPDYFEKNQPDSSFSALNAAFVKNGAYIKSDKNILVKEIIHLIHITTEADTITFPRNIIRLSENSEATILESFISFSPISYFTNAYTDIVVESGAHLHYYRAQCESLEGFHIGTTKIIQEKDSRVETLNFTTGAKLSRHNLDFILNGEGTHSILNGLLTLSNSQHTDNHTSVDHKYPNCISRQLYKGILNDTSRSVFNGKIFVRQDAQKTNAYQLNKHILLSPKAHVDTKPQLEIDADDVKCTHGATIGQLSQDELFYLQTRAIDKTLAKKILCNGFINDVLNQIQNSDVRSRLVNYLHVNEI